MLAAKAAVIAAVSFGAALPAAAVAVAAEGNGCCAPTATTFFSAALPVLPLGAADWLLRVTPAAGFAIQQSMPHAQVTADYTPGNGYFPLPPWAGFAVLCAWAALAVTLAAVALRRRDA